MNKICSLFTTTLLLLVGACGTENTDNSKADTLVRIETSQDVQKQGIAFYEYDSASTEEIKTIRFLSSNNIEVGNATYKEANDFKFLTSITNLIDERLNNTDFRIILVADIYIKVFNDLRFLERKMSTCAIHCAVDYCITETSADFVCFDGCSDYCCTMLWMC